MSKASECRTTGVHKSLGRGGVARVTVITLKRPKKAKTAPPRRKESKR
jgi:hypothetical protein